MRLSLYYEPIVKQCIRKCKELKRVDELNNSLSLSNYLIILIIFKVQTRLLRIFALLISRKDFNFQYVQQCTTPLELQLQL
jgi:hypothetical protein